MKENPKSEKLQKVLANQGLGSRREIEGWIDSKRIYVNGKLAKLGDRVVMSDEIKVDGRLQKNKAKNHRYLLYNKPAGEICSQRDQKNRKRVFDTLPKLRGQRWISVGRLDVNTSGLLLFSTDGLLANKLMHPSSRIEREYAVRVLGDVQPSCIAAMKSGVVIDNTLMKFSDIQKSSTRESDKRANHWFYVVLMEGRNREVRKLWESQGYVVSRLKRVRYGTFFIPSSVRVGQYKELGKNDVRALHVLAGINCPP
ncbi:MAG: pseudouridine synthase [Pseudomonadota bacterium]|nr:pseudouridine synthase [Pseudomonadota bacterium]